MERESLEGEMRSCCAIGLAGWILSVAGTADGVTGRLFWSNRDSIQTSAINGSGIQTLLSGPSLNTAADVEFDPVSQKLYFSDVGNHTIKRMNPDGTGVQTLLSSLSSPIGVELDLTNGKMYWSDSLDTTIRRANLDGTDVETILTAGTLGDVYHFDVDPVGGYVYWAARSLRQIRRAPLAGGPAEILSTTPDWTHGISLDLASGRMYFTEGFRRQLWRSNLDGSSRVPLHTFPADATVGDLELDLVGGHIYLSDNAATRIWRVNLNGSSAVPVVDLADPPPANLLGIAVVPIPEPGGALILGGSLFMIAAYRRRALG